MIRRVFLLALCTVALFGQDGAAIFKSGDRAATMRQGDACPPTSALRTMSTVDILSALNEGTMKAQAAGLSSPERNAVASHLASTERSGAATIANASNTRFQASEKAGITARQVPALKVKWAFNRGASAVPRSQPAVSGNRVFVGADEGKVYGLDAASGCTYWMFQGDNPVRSGMVVGNSGQGMCSSEIKREICTR